MSDQTADILELARKRIDYVDNAMLSNKLQAKRDLLMVWGEQWDDKIKTERDIDDRPYLTINKLRKYVKKLVNDQRQNKPSIKVRPVDDKGDKEMARIIEDLIRSIEYQSVAGVAYTTAFDHAASSGFGYFRIDTDYAGDDTFDQEIQINRIKNNFTVHYDQSGNNFDFSDAKYCFVTDNLPREEFRQDFPNAAAENVDLDNIGEEYEKWYEDDTVRVAEYFYKEPITKTIAQLGDGTVVDIEDVPEGEEPADTREVSTHKVMWCLITGSQILEGPTELPGKYIPIVPVIGDEMVIEGVRKYRSLIRDAVDPQKMYNYWRTTATEHLALTPKAPYLATPEQIQGHEKMWREANRKNHPVLLYNDTAKGAPQRAVPPTVPAGIVAEGSIAGDDIEDVLGMYPPSMGKPSNERSGKAIMMRQKESEITNFGFVDNIRLSLIYAGKIIIDLIPKIYDTSRMIRLINPEGEEQLVAINQIAMKGDQKVGVNDVSWGKYDVTVEVGPSFSTKRLEAAESMMQFIQFAPELAPLIGDLVAKYMDWPGADDVKKRLEMHMQMTYGQMQEKNKSQNAA